MAEQRQKGEFEHSCFHRANCLMPVGLRVDQRNEFLPPITSIHEVAKGARILDSRLARHAPKRHFGEEM
jgi:hypothetical protein